MSIVDAIKKLREQLTGEPGKGASITDAINDLTEGLTGDPGVGASIADALSNLAEHAEDISGGSLKVLYDGPFTSTELSQGLYAAGVTMQESVRHDNPPAYIKAVYNGESYMLPLFDEMAMLYGEASEQGIPIFTTYPIALAISGDGPEFDTLMIVTQAAETNTLKASAKIAEGGGGTSDFTVATVTITSGNNIPAGRAYMPNIAGDQCVSAEAYYTGGGVTTSFSVPLYKGRAAVDFNTKNYTSGNITFTGSATKNTTWKYSITGDCQFSVNILKEN